MVAMTRDRHTGEASKRVQSENLGRRAETLVTWYLRLKGYSILARRFKCPVGEIDIIARQGGTLVFVEVKARRIHSDALLSVTAKQSGRIVSAAKIWLAKEGSSMDSDCRFDIVTVSTYLMPRHFKNAFGDDTNLA